ncbi:FxLYD domain-containing protein [Kitasatospora sp. NPDC088134]|uniref:FxLYD domain-containing protein n=1 Tax=Kitasatospora sp. NPDC088134 TaxID=3364071 RepID=UPI0037F396BF
MKRSMRAAAGWTAAALLGGAALAGCSSDGSPSPGVSSALDGAKSAVASAASSATAAIGSAAASLGASAQAAASSALAGVKGGLDATADVAAGTASTDGEGKVVVPLTVTNHGSQSGKYTIQVNFQDGSGNLLDAAVVNVPELAAGASAQATARSNRALNGTVTPAVANALRY